VCVILTNISPLCDKSGWIQILRASQRNLSPEPLDNHSDNPEPDTTGDCGLVRHQSANCRSAAQRSSRVSVLSRASALQQAALVGQIVPMPFALPMDLPISRPDRIRPILRNGAAGDALRVHADRKSREHARIMSYSPKCAETGGLIGGAEGI
jgi:hypothetical protein